MGLFDGLYAALGATPDASADDLKKAFRKIARECHPDIAGDDPAKARRFKEAREAYEVLTDPARRAAFEAAVRPPPGPGPRKRSRGAEDHGAFFRAFYSRASGGAGTPTGGDRPDSRGRRVHVASPADDFFGVGGEPDGGRTPPRGARGGPDLRGAWKAATGGASGQTGEGADFMDDLFRDFGYGAGAAPAGGTEAGDTRTSGTRARRGDDVIVDLDVPAAVCQRGGTFPARYVHLVRDEAWRPGDPSPGVMPRHEEVELDLPPGTRHAAIRRYRGLGDAGPWGGPPGDLVVRVRVLDAPHEPGERQAPPPSGPFEADPGRGVRTADAADAEVQRRSLDLTVAEALLGGRIEVTTPQGKVRMSVPPCTSSGQTFRLRGRGEHGPDGAPRDLLLEVRILAPRALDEESQRLIEAFARLNPEVPER